MRPIRGSAVRIMLAVLVAPALLHAQQSPLARAARVAAPPVIDGRLDDDAWSGLEPLEGFTQREPSEGQPVSQPTEVRVGHDDAALYIGAWLFDEDPSGIVTGQTRRDASLNDSDAFVVVLDTYLDRQNAFVFGTTPAGIEYDGQVTGEGVGGGRGGGRQQRGSAGGFNLNWDGSWEVATTRDERVWFAEMRIPFSTLRYGAGGAQDWGLNFERRIRRNSEQSMWAPLPRQFDVYRISLAGTLTLEAPARRTVTVSPYALVDGFRDYGVTPSDVAFGRQIGGDAKIGLNQSLTLDWEFRANTNRGAPLSLSVGWALGGFYTGTNVRLAWLDTAGTGLYIVWNDTNHTGSLERTGIMAGPKQRQLVVKYSRLFNLTG